MVKYGSSQSEVEQLLCTCSGFLYLGMEHFGTTIPPAKIAALNMSGIARAYMVVPSTQDLSERSLWDFKCWGLYERIIVCRGYSFAQVPVIPVTCAFVMF